MSDFAFLFPGQGSQSAGMLDAYPDTDGVVTRTLDESSEALGRDLGALIHRGPEEELNRTENTQPAMLAAGVAAFRLWITRGGPAPAFLAGHSLGEYAALVAAGSLDLPEAVRLVADRSRFMQEAVPPGEGKMAAILGLDDATVLALCEAHEDSGVVTPANFNAPGQVVIAGEAPLVDLVVAAAKEAGAKRAVELPVSIPSHCPLMMPAGDLLAERLANTELSPPEIPVINNVDVETPSQPDAIRSALARQVARPVQWTRTVERLKGEGIARVFEMGPGKVLCGLNKRIDRRMPCLPVVDAASLDEALEAAG